MILVAKLFRPATVLAFLLLLCGGCGESGRDSVRLQGSVYGTGWSVQYLPVNGGPTETEVHEALVAAFAVVDASMNTYSPESTISALNNAAAGELLELDWDFSYLLNEALRINRLSQGAYDVAVAPLLRIWGFGPEGPRVFPNAASVEEARQLSGFSHFKWDSATRNISKDHVGAALELSSIAKGYGVDLGADVLEEMGLKDFMLDIGGEIQVRGVSPRGDAWRIAIERPQSGGRAAQAAIAVTNTGVATSGDYRNFFERDGKRFSHLIDPRTGYPVEHDLVSVTVVHGSTALADAWATALAVLGTEQALATAEAQHLAVYLISRRGDVLVASMSSGFKPYLVTSPAQG